MLGRIVLILVLAVIGVHLYFYLTYGSFDPCKAAAMRAINQQKSDVARGVGIMLSEPLENAIRSEGVETCYRIALTGESPRFPIPH